jgi:hypothetical protein
MFGTDTATPSLAPGGQPLAEVGAQLLFELLRLVQARPDESKLTRRLVRAKERLRTLESHVTYLASALGICPSCLSTLVNCPVCGGQGAAGQLPIDSNAFAQIVGAVFERRPELLELVTQADGNGTGSSSHMRPPTAAAGSRNGDLSRGNGNHERNGGFHA